MELLIFIVGIAVLTISVAIAAHLQKRIDKLESIMNAELAMARDSLYLAKKQLKEHGHEDIVDDTSKKVLDWVESEMMPKLQREQKRYHEEIISLIKLGNLDVIDKNKTYTRREVEDYLNITQYQRNKLVKQGLLSEKRRTPTRDDNSEYYYDGKDVMDYHKKIKEEAVK